MALVELRDGGLAAIPASQFQESVRPTATPAPIDPVTSRVGALAAAIPNVADRSFALVRLFERLVAPLYTEDRVIVREQPDMATLNGLTCWDPVEGAWCITVKERRPGLLFHELSHIAMGHLSKPTTRPPYLTTDRLDEAAAFASVKSNEARDTDLLRMMEAVSWVWVHEEMARWLDDATARDAVPPHARAAIGG